MSMFPIESLEDLTIEGLRTLIMWAQQELERQEREEWEEEAAHAQLIAQDGWEDDGERARRGR